MRAIFSCATSLRAQAAHSGRTLKHREEGGLLDSRSGESPAAREHSGAAQGFSDGSIIIRTLVTKVGISRSQWSGGEPLTRPYLFEVAVARMTKMTEMLRDSIV